LHFFAQIAGAANVACLPARTTGCYRHLLLPPGSPHDAAPAAARCHACCRWLVAFPRLRATATTAPPRLLAARSAPLPPLHLPLPLHRYRYRRCRAAPVRCACRCSTAHLHYATCALHFTTAAHTGCHIRAGCLRLQHTLRCLRAVPFLLYARTAPPRFTAVHHTRTAFVLRCLAHLPRTCRAARVRARLCFWFMPALPAYAQRATCLLPAARLRLPAALPCCLLLLRVAASARTHACRLVPRC